MDHSVQNTGFSIKRRSIDSLTPIFIWTVYLVVIEIVYERDEAPGLVLQSQRQFGNMADEYSVKDLRHFQVIAGTRWLEKRGQGSTLKAVASHVYIYIGCLVCVSRLRAGKKKKEPSLPQKNVVQNILADVTSLGGPPFNLIALKINDGMTTNVRGSLEAQMPSKTPHSPSGFRLYTCTADYCCKKGIKDPANNKLINRFAFWHWADQ